MTDEYIRKADAIDEVNHALDRETILFSFVRKVAISALKKLPPADVAPVVHAHWIQTSAKDENDNAYYYCSNCGSGESHNPIVEVPYCWKCGAKMDDGELDGR